MKYIFSNGLKLEVREIGEVIYELQADRSSKIPLPPITKQIYSDDEARKILKAIKNTKNYKRIK